MSLVEVGGWHPLLPAAELAAVAGQPLRQLAPRLFHCRDELDWSRLAYARRGLRLLGSSLRLDLPFDPATVVDGSYAVRLHDPDHLLPALADVRRIDARTLGDWGLVFDAVVTDLPYGRSASTHGAQVPDLFLAFLATVADVVRAGARVIVMAPAGLPDPTDARFDVITVLRERVNRSLTREIWVLHRRPRTLGLARNGGGYGSGLPAWSMRLRAYRYGCLRVVSCPAKGT